MTAIASRPAAAETRVNLVQGEFFVTADDNTVLSTLLGSCVAACLTDRHLGIGGMNHFLLPGQEQSSDADSREAVVRHGVHAMELLVNGLLKLGARRERLEAKLFGGARMLNGLTDIGGKNADFAERFIQRERIAMVGGSLRGDRGRRIQYWPASGRARQIMIAKEDDSVFTAERRTEWRGAPKDTGSLELF